MIRQEIIDKIQEQTDIVEVIGAHVKLRKSGTRYVGCCPFHNERTPSFYVFPNTDTFKCFGCGEGGDVIHFIKKKENKTFVEAVKTLADKAHIEIEEQEESVEAKQKRLHREALWIANKQVADFYRKQFLQSKEAQGYAYQRWGEDYCTLKEIGYAPADGHAPYNSSPLSPTSLKSWACSIVAAMTSTKTVSSSKSMTASGMS